MIDKEMDMNIDKIMKTNRFLSDTRINAEICWNKMLKTN